MRIVVCCLIAVACTVVLLSAAPPANGEQTKKPAVEEPSQKVEISPKLLDKVRNAVAMIAYLDPVTGEMRAPTAEERAALLGQPATRTAGMPAASPRAIALPQGGFAVETDPSRFEFAVAVQGANGKITYRCARPGAHGSKAGQANGGKNDE